MCKFKTLHNSSANTRRGMPCCEGCNGIFGVVKLERCYFEAALLVVRVNLYSWKARFNYGINKSNLNIALSKTNFNDGIKLGSK